jgi:iron complex transport system substrate-binding protein
VNVNEGDLPDQGYTYLLIKTGTDLPHGIPINQVIEIPVDNLVVTSTSHIAFLDLLQGVDRLVGFPNTQYISSGNVRSRIEKGLIKDVGTSSGINIESLIELQPELVVHYTSGADRAELGLLDQSNIPYVINLDFLEESPLGRAEWIKFMGFLVGEEDLADSIFHSIKMGYLDLTRRTDSLLNRPTVFSGVLYGDTWFAPGAKSFVASFIQDAGGDYTWKDHRTSGSVELSFEAVLSRNSGSDFWIGAGRFASKASLYAADSRYSSFQAFQSDQIYNYHGKIGATGGFEYLEQGGARPDIVLADFIKILHPELVSSHQLYFFKKLE